MRTIFTFLNHLRGSMGNLQSSDVSLDRRLTVGSPSGLDAKWKQNPFMRFAVALLLLLTLGVGNAWGADVVCTLSNANIMSAGDPEGGYKSWSFTDGCSQTWTAYCIKNKQSNADAAYNHIQIKAYSSSTAYYLQVPAKTGYTIKSITMVVSSTSVVHNGGNNTATLYFSSSNNSNTAASGVSANPKTAVSGTGASSITLNCDALKLTTGYITASAGMRIWGDVSVTYTSAAPTERYTVTYNAGTGSCKGSETEGSAGAGVTLPTPTHSCSSDGWAFYGWKTGSLVTSETSTAPAIVGKGGDTYYPTGDVTLYAVYAKGEYTKETSSITSGSKYLIVASSGGHNHIMKSSSDDFRDYSGDKGMAAIQIDETSSGKYHIADVNANWCYTIEGTAGNYYIRDVVNSSSSNYADIAYDSWWGHTIDSEDKYTITVSSGVWTIKNNYYNSGYGYTYLGYDSSDDAFFGFGSAKDILLYKETTTPSYYSNPTCCTPLGTINGSINMTSSTDGTVTVKDWSEVSYASSYTVKLYQKNGESWDLVAGDAGTKTGITNRSTGATFSGLTYGATYKFKVTAIGTGSYCDGPETAVTSINGNSLTNNEFLNKYYIHIDDGTQSDSGWEDYYFTSLTSHAGSVDVTLNAFTDYYQYKLSLGGVIWWGNNSKMTSSDHTNWTLYTAHGNVKLQTAMGGTYTFGLNAATPAVTVTYPTSNQASGYHIYFDNSILEWSTLRYRIGNHSHNQNSTLALVTGTDNFYVATTPSYDGMEAWHIANNTGWADSHTIYRTATNNESGQPEIAITASIVFQQYKVTEDITVIPTTSHTTGTDNTGDKVNNQCEFYTINTPTSGMLTHTATITAPSNGTINLAYTNTSGTSCPTNTSTVADLAHRTILTATATPATGYQLSTFTVTPSGESAQNLSSGDNHILAKDATFAATFAAKTYAISLDRNGGTTGATEVTMTYNSSSFTGWSAPSRTGYTFDGYYTSETGDNGSGTLVINSSGVLQANVDGYTGANGIWTKDATCTLYAKWTPVNYTITYHLNDGTNPGDAVTGFTIESALITLPTPTREGYNFMGWYANENLSTGGVQTTIAAASTGDKEYWAKWEIKKYTVTWHVGESTSTTSNVEHFTTFSTLEASAPAHADNALAACGSTKFIGWVKAAGAWTEEGKTVDWYNTYKYAAADEITSDVDIYAMYAEAGDPASDWTKYEESTLAEGDYLLIQSYSTYKVILKANVDATPRFTKTTATITAGVVTSPDTKTEYIWRLSKSGNYYKFYNPNSGKYIVSTGTKSQADLVTTPTDDKDLFSVTYNTTDHYITITNKYNSTNSVNADFKYGGDYWACYSGTANIDLYWRAITYTNYRTGCTVSCSRPTPSTPTSVTKTSATISWTDPATSGTLDHYEYKVWEDGDDEPVSGTTNGKNLSKALTGLYSGVTYHWKVRRVCDGEDASIWVAGSDFTTTEATLTFSVPTGATAVDPSTTATNLPEADAPTDCGDCWAFVGWTTAAYAESSSAPATLFPAGIKARVSGDATLYAVYKKTKYRIVGDLAGISADEYYVLTYDAIGPSVAMKNAVTETYYTTKEDVVIKEDNTGAYLENPSADATWIFTGTTSAGRFQNVGNNKYIDLSDYNDPPIATSTSDYVNITVENAGAKRFDIESNTTDGNYLQLYNKGWGVDEEHSGYFSCRIFKRAEAAYATTPSCPKYTVTWDINNGATTSTTDVTKCEGYLSELPSAPADNTLSGCQTNGKFMGWSASKVMPAQDIAPADIFSEVEDAPEITENVTFYAVFANGVAGAATPVNTTYTFNSKSWGDATNSWSSNTAGDELTSGRGIKILGSASAEGITKNSYTDVTKVVVTYCTNASSGTGSVTVTVGDTEFGTNSISKPSSGGATLKTFTYTHAAATGKVKISASASTNSIYIYSVQIYYTGAGTVYEQYRTACCNDPGFSFTDENDAPVTEYVIVREDLASASDAVEIDCNYTSSNSTGAITWYSTRRAAKTFPSTGAYTWTTPSSQPANMNIDLANRKIAAMETGVWTITISQADGGTTYCPVDAVVTVRVKTVDKFVDAVNGNFGGDAQRREDTGDGITLPTEAEFSIDDGCSTERRLLGWVKESDLSGYTSGYIDSWKTDDPATNKVIAPGTKVQATGITWYAVWGTEK